MFISTLHPSPLLPFVPMAVGKYQLQGRIERGKGFNLNQFSWVVQGELSVKIGGEIRTLHSGEGFFFRKGVPHIYEPNTNEVPIACWVCFLNGEELLDYFGIKDYFFFKCPPMISEKAVALSDLCESTQSEVLMAAEGYKWASELLDFIFEKPKTKCEEITFFLEQNYGRLISLDEIAEHFGIDKYALCRIYRETGTTVMDMLKTIRIKKAKRFLWQTAYSVSEIGLMCGFSDTSYFIKKFKEVVGCTPHKYRSDKNS